MGLSQLTLWPLLCGEGDVSLELGIDCLRVRFEGGDIRGLEGLLTSLPGSF